MLGSARVGTALLVPGADTAASIAPQRRDRGLLALLAAFSATLLLIPDRYTVPAGRRAGLRPQQIVVVALSIGVAVGFRRGCRLDVGRPALLAGLLVVVAVVSLVANVGSLTTSAYLGAVRVVVTLSLLVLLAVVVSVVAPTPRRRRYLLGLVVSVAAVAAVFAINESVTQAVPAESDALGADGAAGPECAPRGDAEHVHPQRVPRPAGLASNPLELSGVMALSSPFAVYLAVVAVVAGPSVVPRVLPAHRARARPVASRTGVLSAAVMLAVALVANVRRPRIVLLGLVAVAALGFSVAASSRARRVADRADRQGRQRGSEPGGSRTTRRLDRLFGPHPWLGGGPNSITTYLSRDGTGMILDNQYLLTIAETGLIGLGVFVVVVVATANAAVRRWRALTPASVASSSPCSARRRRPR